jgi:hypothetical protein
MSPAHHSGCFTKTKARREYNLKRRILHGGRSYVAPRVAVRIVGESKGTLIKWQKRCPWRAGCKGIRTLPLESAYGRTFTYYFEDDLIEIRDAKAERAAVPSVDGFVYIDDAVREVGCSLRTLRRRAAARKVKFVKRPGKSKDGRALPRTYLPRSFVDECKAAAAEGRNLEPPEGKVTVAGAAESLGLTSQGVHSLIRYGVLGAEDGKFTCERGYPLDGKLLESNEVEKWKQIRTGEAKPEEETDARGTWVPSPLVPKKYPRITLGVLRFCTNKPHPSYGDVAVTAEPREWKNGFRFPRRPKPLGFLDADLRRLDGALRALDRESATRKGILGPLRQGGERTLSQLAVALKKSRAYVWRVLKELRGEGSVKCRVQENRQGRGAPAQLWAAVRIKRAGGRPPKKQTKELHKYCYERYVRGDKLSAIREGARQVFGARAPKQDGHVTGYARRYAEGEGLPFTTRNAAKSP